MNFTSDRPHRTAISKEGDLKEIARFSGTQFEPIVAGVLPKIAADESWCRPESMPHFHSD
jgi:HD-GYP domain-containing protein (c-di-GMP phosphodiesterase class II)